MSSPLSGQLLRAMDTFSDAVLLTDADGIVLYANQAMLRQCGFNEDQLIGQPMADFWVQPNALTQFIMAELAAKRTWRGRIQHKASDGHFFWETVTISPVMDEHDTLTSLMKTGRKETPEDEKLAVAEQLDNTYQSILDLMGDGYMEVDLKGNATFFNKNIPKIYQRSPEEIMGLNFRAYMKPEEAEKMYRIFNQIYRTGRYDGIIDYEAMAKDGTPFYCETITTLLHDRQGNPVGFGGIIRDVTEKKLLAQQLKESEESYRRVMELAPDAITISRVSDGKYYEVNETFCQQTGYPRDEVIGRTVLGLNIYADPADRKRVVHQLRTTGFISGMRATFLHRDGSILHDIISARIIRFKGEECVLMVATLINTLVEAQNALRESEKKFRMILSAAPDPICLTRLEDGRYIEANDAFYDQTGFTPEETIGRTATEIGIYADSADRSRFVAALRKNGLVDSMEITSRYKDGTLAPSLWSGRVVEYAGEQCLLVVAKSIVELKEAQQLLKEREQSYRTILDTAPYSIVITRRSDARYVLVNDAFCRQAGYSREEALGRTPFELNLYIDPTDRDRMVEKLQHHGHVASMEISFRSKSGEILDSLVSVSPINYWGEACILTITTDIRELKKARRELERSEESYRAIIEAAPYAIDIIDHQTLRYIAVNDRFCDYTGLTRDEAIGRIAGELKFFKNRRQLKQLSSDLYNNGRVEGMELEIQHRDGRIFNTLCSMTPIRYMGRQCFMSTNVNLTPLKRAQSAQRESEARFRAIFDTAADAIFVTDLESGRFLDVNQAACQHLGYSAKTLEKMYLKDVIHPHHPYRMPPESMQGHEMERVVFFESMHIGKDGTPMSVEVSSGTVMRSGRPALLSIVRDVSERKRVEAELAKYRQHLENMVQERTDELKAAHDELVKREKLAVLGQLTATVSHELRNPLGVIRSSNFFLSRKIKARDEKIDKHIRRIEEQVSLCDTIVADLLEFTRGSRAMLKKQDMRPWLEQVVDQLRESENFDIQLDIPPDLPQVPHDQEKMRRVVINLINNAVQAVNARQEALERLNAPYRPVVALKVARHAGGLRLQVTDNGCGMDEPTRQRAFEPLFTTRARGTGIGLANVTKIVSEHDGRITLESEQDQGTTMTIFLPLETARIGTA